MDSDPNVVESLKRLFERVGFDVSTFEKLNPLLEKLDEEHPQSVLAETLPTKAGNVNLVLDTHRLIPGLPIILLASSGDVSTAVRTLRAGATNYVEKPIVDRLLIEIVERAIANFLANR